MKKEAALAKAPEFFDVKIEALVPAVITYRISATSPEEALRMTKNTPPRNVQYRLPAKREKKATVYTAGTTIIRLIKSLLG